MGRARRVDTSGPQSSRRPPTGFAVASLLTLVAFLARWLFWRATPDAAWAGSALYKGDASVWLEWAAALRRGGEFELGLPFRPPGMAYLEAWLGDGSAAGIVRLEELGIFLSALTVGLFYGAARRDFGGRVGLLVGIGCAFSTALLALSTSLNNEAPYLFLVAAALLAQPGAAEQPKPRRIGLCAALHGLACLFRVEHVLFVAALGGFLAWRWRRLGRRSAWPVVAAAAAGFLLPLLPWHVHAWRVLARFEGRESAESRAAIERAETSVAGVRWTPEALAARDRLPALIRERAGLFVAATIAHRGGDLVRGDDMAVLTDAFGPPPSALPRHPFVALYGPLNFYLANQARSDGGFDRAPLEEPPPLRGGSALYPAALVAGLPPSALTFAYPPHLRAITDGYGLGWQWIRGHPGDALRLAGRKLALFWRGAALGVTGYGAPLGIAGVRRPVDLAAPEGGVFVSLWRWGVLLIAALGALAARGRGEIVPWLLFLASKILVTLAFFGYVRQGAAVAPVIVLLVALAADRWLLTPLAIQERGLRWSAATLLALGLGVEAARATNPPTLALDGVRIGPADPFPADDFAPHVLTSN